MQLNIPIYLTLFRIVLIPFFILAAYLPISSGPFWCALIFVIAAITDWFDGFLARLWQQTTKFGAFLDPVADKIMVSVALVLITEHYHTWWITLPALVMIAREIIISALREWMAELGKRSNVSVSWVGKTKTAAQMLSLIGLLWHPNAYILVLSVLLLYLSAVLTCWSMFQYIIAAQNEMFKK